jgi:hypothetical protein
MEVKAKIDNALDKIAVCGSNRHLHKFMSSMIYEGTIFAFFGGYFSYLLLHRFSGGAVFGYALMLGYNQSLLLKAFK